MKMTVFWNIVSCSLIELDVSGRIALMMEAVSTSEISINIHETIRRNIPADSHLHGKSTSRFQSACKVQSVQKVCIQ
jgi:hypothetical protein